MNTIAKTAAKLLGQRQAFVLATIVGRHGSTPRMAGTRMIVAADGLAIGTIGGGALEAQVIRQAGEVLASKRPLLVSFDMTPSELAAMDMICGGQLEVLLEFIDSNSAAAEVFRGWRDVRPAAEPALFLTMLRMEGGTVADSDHCLLKDGRVVSGNLPLAPSTVAQILRDHSDAIGLSTVTKDDALILVDPVLAEETLFLFGAGHVSRPTALFASAVGFRVRVVDDRAEFANADRFPEADGVRVITDFGAALEGVVIDPDCFIVIVTRGHLHDRTVLAQALKTEAGYIGMIGSRRKRDHIYDALLKQGFTPADLNRVHCPIGLEIAAETPEEIALSIVAEMVQVRARRRCR